jgi:hypothetical protein
MSSRRMRQWAVVPLLLGGCVHVYQPLLRLQDPVAVHPREGNFQGVRVLVSCIPGDFVDRVESEELCQHAGDLFTKQGAIVQTRTGPAPRPGAETKGPPPELQVDLSARQIYEENSTLLWLVSIGTLTLVPAISEYTFAQDVSIRDADGVLLASDSWQARFVRYFGFTTWAVNALLDLAFRTHAERLTGDAFEEEFSKDYYGQLTQMVFNAHARWALLHPKTAAGKQ